MENNIDQPSFHVEEENKSPLQLALIFGVCLTVLLLGIQFITRPIMENADYSGPAKYLGMLTYIPLLAGLIYFIVMHRDKNCGGNIKYSKAFGAAMLCVLFYSLFTALSTYLWFTFDPEMLAKIQEKSKEAMEKTQPDMDEEKMQEALAMAAKFQTPLMMTIFSLLGNIIFGAVLALIAAAFQGSFRKKSTPNNI
ncbi:MAG: DUF4199 domain-containing protein [Bacteroidetes bacterium]|nr:DUF4199 domain-containing protein [Bacteroidota bacterium]